MEAARPTTLTEPEIRPARTLWLLSTAHAVNHAVGVVLPLVYVAIIPEYGVTAGFLAALVGVGAFVSGFLQLAFAGVTRLFSRRSILAAGNVVMGLGMALQGIAPGFFGFAVANLAGRIGGTPQHPVGNALLAEQFSPARRGFAIAAHIAGGNLGTIAVPLVGAWLIAGVGWRWTVVLFGVPAILIGLAMFVLIRESGADRAAAKAQGSVRDAFRAVRRDRDLRWIYASAVLGGGGRGLGVVTLFAVLYLDQVLRLDSFTSGLMYTVLVIGSVPAPLIAGWLSDRLGRKPMIIAVYLGGAVAFGVFMVAGSSLALLWLAIVLMSAFTFVESPQLQAFMADVAPAGIRDAAFAVYFTLAFGIGSLWTVLYGFVVDGFGPATGIPLVFGLMAASFLAAALAVLPISGTRASASSGSE